MNMKLITTIIMTLFAGAGLAVASERIDSVSYAFGHQYTLGIMAGKNDMMQTEQDFRDYIRGLEDNIGNPRQMADSTYMMSYCLGSMEAVFMTDGLHHKKKEELPPFHCIISGLRKVGEGKINLPADTIAARDFLNRHSDDDKKASDLDKETECEFFTSYGIMKAYQPGLQQYINGLKPGTNCVENRQAFATGMADILEAYTIPPATAYDQGRMIALSMNLTSIEQDQIDPASFVAGAKASLGLGPQIISRNEVDEMGGVYRGKYRQTCSGVYKRQIYVRTQSQPANFGRTLCHIGSDSRRNQLPFQKCRKGSSSTPRRYDRDH